MRDLSAAGVLRPTLCCALLFGWLTGCAGDSAGPTEPAPATVARVTIAPDSAVLAAGQTQAFTARAFSASGAEISGRAVAWSSNNQAVVSIDAGGIATATGSGTARVLAKVDGVTASASLRVREPAPARVVISPDSAVLFIGQSQTLTAKALDANGAELGGRTVQWSTSDANVVSIPAPGAVRGESAGSATITATVDGTAAAVTVRARENPVKSTSYANFKEVGLQPFSIPLPATEHWGFHELARGYGDFFGSGNLDLFTSTVDYDSNEGPQTTTRATYRFWRKQDGGYVEDNHILVPGGTPCLHSRKALVADFNLDGRPDIFIACHGYDASPYPGERNQILLSQSDGRYQVRDAAPDIGFWHGAAAADLNGDAYPDVIATGFTTRLFLNNGDGTFAPGSMDRLPDLDHKGQTTIEIADVDEDGDVDLLLAGADFGDSSGSAPPRVWLNPGSGDFTGVTPVIIPRVEGLGIVADFVITGTGADRTIWLSRTAHEPFYRGAAIQRYNWRTGSSALAAHDESALWVPWLIGYTRSGTRYVGSDDLRTPMEVVVP